MITYEQAVKLTQNDHVHYTGPGARSMSSQPCTTIIGPRGGVTVKTNNCRVNGAVKTWKTRPGEFRVPVKYGMREYGEVNHRNARSWHLADECEEKYMRTIDNRPVKPARTPIELLREIGARNAAAGNIVVGRPVSDEPCDYTLDGTCTCGEHEGAQS